MPITPANTNPNPNPGNTNYDPNAIFRVDSPIDHGFMMDAIQTLMRAFPLGTSESAAAVRRRNSAAMIALAAANPRDPIEVMLAVQAISAYHAAAACWRLGMNTKRPHGDSTRHISAAATAARTFDTMLKAIERRQAKALSIPVGRPEPRAWTENTTLMLLDRIADRIVQDDDMLEPAPSPEPSDLEWSPEAVALVHEMREQDRIEEENAGLDIANTEGIRPDGSIIMPEDPTPQQAAYIARRLALMYKREYAESLSKGIDKLPTIRPLRVGDVVP